MTPTAQQFLKQANWTEKARRKLDLDSNECDPKAESYAKELVQRRRRLGLPVGHISTHKCRKQQQCHDALLESGAEFQELAARCMDSKADTNDILEVGKAQILVGGKAFVEPIPHWYIERDGEIPEGFGFGPKHHGIAGTLKDLGLLLGDESSNPGRTVEQAHKEETVCVRRVHRTRYELWLPTEPISLKCKERWRKLVDKGTKSQ